MQCLQDYNISLYLSHTVVDIHGKERLTGVTVAKVDEKRQPIPGTEIEFDCDTLLLSVGLIPENELSQGAGVTLSPVTSGAVVSDALETSVPGIFACGNVLHVHDLVDFVSKESFRAGEMAARYAQGQRRTGQEIAVRDGAGVRGVVPQRILLNDTATPIELMFRPDRVYKNHFLVVYADGKPLTAAKKMILTPGEMTTQTLNEKLLTACQGAKEISLAIVPEKPEIA